MGSDLESKWMSRDLDGMWMSSDVDGKWISRVLDGERIMTKFSPSLKYRFYNHDSSRSNSRDRTLISIPIDVRLISVKSLSGSRTM